MTNKTRTVSAPSIAFHAQHSLFKQHSMKCYRGRSLHTNQSSLNTTKLSFNPLRVAKVDWNKATKRIHWKKKTGNKSDLNMLEMRMGVFEVEEPAWKNEGGERTGPAGRPGWDCSQSKSPHLASRHLDVCKGAPTPHEVIFQ